MASNSSRRIKEVSRDLSSSTPRNPLSPFNPNERLVMDLIFRALRNNQYPPSVRQIAGRFHGRRSTSFAMAILKRLAEAGYIRKPEGSMTRAIMPVIACATCNGSGRIALPSVLEVEFPNENLKNAWYYMVNHETSTGSPPTARHLAEVCGFSPGMIGLYLKKFREMGLVATDTGGSPRLRTFGVVPCPDCVMKPQPWETHHA